MESSMSESTPYLGISKLSSKYSSISATVKRLLALAMIMTPLEFSGKIGSCRKSQNFNKAIQIRQFGCYKCFCCSRQGHKLSYSNTQGN